MPTVDLLQQQTDIHQTLRVALRVEEYVKLFLTPVQWSHILFFYLIVRQGFARTTAIAITKLFPFTMAHQTTQITPEEDYSDDQYYHDFVAETVATTEEKPCLLRQRVTKKELVALVAKASRYPQHEVEDVIKGLWTVINNELEQGREFDIGGLFTARLYKPFPRRIYDFKLEGFKMSDPRPKLKLVPTDMYQRYLWKGIHAPVNYFAPARIRNQGQSPEEFTLEYNTAYQKWLAEHQRREAKKEKE